MNSTEAYRPPAPRFLAHYLPQFHPIPENDQWWGKGFTEWTNVTKAKQLFREHYQPHLPGDLGFYDLRLPEARAAQAELAKRYGIHGFMYYHYWFPGKRLIQRPFEEVLRSGQPHFPFCLCWANETWSRRWQGEEKEILIKQTYTKGDMLEHARWLAEAFADSRYVRVSGRPVFLIYRPKDIPEEIRAVEVLRQEVQRLGVADPFLIAVDAHDRSANYRALGYDHVLGFEPALGTLPEAFIDEPTWHRWQRNLKLRIPSGVTKIYEYEAARKFMEAEEVTDGKIPCLMVDWDNSPRRGKNGIVFVNGGPKSFARALEKKLRSWAGSKPSCDLFFLNAWNEWAEGNHLEPDRHHGLGYLESLRSVRNYVANDHGWPAV